MNVLILLSSYNGQRYIKDQIQSIIAQTNVDLKILIRDDGSTDDTLSILNQIKTSFPDKIDIIEGENIGCSKSFFSLVSIATRKYSDFDYYAFADQDDIWLNDKLISGINALQNSSNPIRLYHSHPQLVDDSLNPINSHRITAKETLAESFILAPGLGCTMIFNFNVLKVLDKASISNSFCLHDFLAYAVTLALGGKVIIDETPHILYRQHSSNVVGGAQSFKKKWKRRFSWFAKGQSTKSLMAHNLLTDFPNEIPPHEKEILYLMANYKHSLSSKLKVIFSKEFRSNKPFHNVMFIIAVLFNKI